MRKLVILDFLWIFSVVFLSVLIVKLTCMLKSVLYFFLMYD